MQMHQDYFTAKRRLDKLVEKFPGLRERTVMIGRLWDNALEKDESGRQCLHVVEDLEELLTPMAN